MDYELFCLIDNDFSLFFELQSNIFFLFFFGIIKLLLCILKSDNYLEILADKEIKDSVAKNVNEAKIAKLLYIFLATPDNKISPNSGRLPRVCLEVAS